MRYLGLIWMNVWRRRIRTTFTLLSIFIAFLLFGIVMTVRNAFSLGVEVAGIDRLVLINKVTLILPLPISYKQKIQKTPGVQEVTHETWFNGAYQQPTNVLSSMAVEPSRSEGLFGIQGSSGTD
jgi:putative ABC transport system permease protein